MRVFGYSAQDDGQHAQVERRGFEETEEALEHTIDDFGVDSLHLFGVEG
jgi:hypothetical protein